MYRSSHTQNVLSFGDDTGDIIAILNTAPSLEYQHQIKLRLGK